MTVATLCDLFRRPIEHAPRPDAFRERRGQAWVDISSHAFAEDVAAIGEALVNLGLVPGDRVAILAGNQYRWAVADMAAITRGAIVVPIYPTLPCQQIEVILRDSGTRFLFVSDGEQVSKLASLSRPPEGMAAAIVFSGDVAAMPEIGIPILGFDAFRERGGALFAARGMKPIDVAGLRDPEDVATIIYTSGTTGHPKGVMLTHSNLVSNVAGALDRFPISREDAVLSFLPLSHVFERVAGYYTMYVAGASIAYARSHETVAEDAQLVRPTILLGVPRFFEKFHSRVDQAIAAASPARRRLYAWALRRGTARADAELSGRSPSLAVTLGAALAHALVFRKLHGRIGGRVRFFVSGGAPLRPDLIRFFHAIGIPVYEGYGLTETSPVICANSPGAVRLGSVGKTFPNVSVRIAADGEIEARGPNLTRGYFRNAAATDELFTPDGWLKTGDIGRLDEDGYLFITDRKKELLVTAGGKKIAPQPIENELCQSRFVTDAMLVGDRRRFIGVVFLPNLKALAEHARSVGLGDMDPAALVAHPEIQALFAGLIAEANRALARFESIKRFVILPCEATVENGLLTPSMKLRRRVIEERFKDKIDSLFVD